MSIEPVDPIIDNCILFALVLGRGSRCRKVEHPSWGCLLIAWKFSGRLPIRYWSGGFWPNGTLIRSNSIRFDSESDFLPAARSQFILDTILLWLRLRLSEVRCPTTSLSSEWRPVQPVDLPIRPPAGRLSTPLPHSWPKGKLTGSAYLRHYISDPSIFTYVRIPPVQPPSSNLCRHLADWFASRRSNEDKCPRIGPWSIAGRSLSLNW